MAWYHRLLNIARSNDVTRDLDREFAHHLAERRDALVEAGMTPAEAEAEARRRFGNSGARKEQARDADLLTWLETCLSDIRYAFRALRRSPAFALVAILSLALGIGANTAIFSLINAVMLKSLPVQHPEQLVAVEMEKGDNTFTNPLWEQIRDRQDMFDGIFATSDTRFDLSTGGEVRQAHGEYVSGDYFTALGVKPAAGRLITRGDDTRGCRAIAVLSAPFWTTEYGADPHAIGKSIELGGKQFEIVGVTDPAYFGMTVGSSTQVYVPLCANAVITGSDASLNQRSQWWLTITARLRPGVPVAQVNSRLKALAPAVFASTLPTDWQASEKAQYLKNTLMAEPQPSGLSDLRQQYERSLYTLMVVVGVVLLIACGNVANLLLARARARQREAAVRLAVGAGRRRLIRQLLTESLVLSGIGTALGVLFAMWGTRVLVSLLSAGRKSVWLDLAIDWRILAFTAGVAVATAVLFGMVPAWRSANVDPQSAMRGTGRGITQERTRFSLARSLVVGQVALSLVLLIGAGLLLGSFQRQTSIDLGFRDHGVLVVNTDIRRVGLAEDARPEFFRQMLQRVSAVPGARLVSSIDIVPLSGAGWNGELLVDGFTPKNKRDGIVWFNSTSPRYFETVGTPMIAGRDFSAADTHGSPNVAILNEGAAKKFFSGKSPIGNFVKIRSGPGDPVPYEVIGVVKNSKYRAVQETNSETVFLASAQEERPRNGIAFAIRTDGPPAAIIPAVRAAIAGQSPLVAFTFSTLDGVVAASLARPRLLAQLSLFFGALALLLAVVGLYGTMSYSVERRRNEIGIRIALGAARSRVLSMVLGEAGWVVVIGIAVGVGLAIAATRWVSSLLYGVTPTDALTFAMAGAALAAVALAASAIPAWRASRLDPMEALRDE
ncbi:MAG TPA: ABC transporter permease [Gemmatimonadaceae bacterium]|nr:ABC transporter permease [Gemmatimonadaceae bacterium]